MAAGTPVLPGGGNTFVKDFRSSGRLQVAFSRNPKKFDLPNYSQIVPVEREAGFFLSVNAEQAGRLVGGELTEHVWPDGADRPQNGDGTEQFNFKDYRTARHAFGFKLGQKAVEQADFDIEKTEAAIHAQQAMTARTVATVKALTTTANWDATHIKDVTTIDGATGGWDESTSARQDIKRSLHYGAEQIELDTLAATEEDQLQLVFSPNTAKAIARTQEIVDHIKGSPDAYAQVRGGEGKFAKYGLPDKLYGFPIAIERAVMVTSPRGTATPVRQRVMPDGVAFLLSRVGELGDEVEGPNFSTITIFVYEDMSVETKRDTDNRRVLGSVVDDFAAVMTAPASGFYFQAVTS